MYEQAATGPACTWVGLCFILLCLLVLFPKLKGQWLFDLCLFIYFFMKKSQTNGHYSQNEQEE